MLTVQLATSARLFQGFCSSTITQYSRMWSDFIAFQGAVGLSPYQEDICLLLAFLKFLLQNGISASHLANYLAALRAFHIIHGLDTTAFIDERIPFFLKDVKIQAKECFILRHNCPGGNTFCL